MFLKGRTKKKKIQRLRRNQTAYEEKVGTNQPSPNLLVAVAGPKKSCLLGESSELVRNAGSFKSCN